MSNAAPSNAAGSLLTLQECGFLEECWRVMCIPRAIYRKMRPAADYNLLLESNYFSLLQSWPFPHDIEEQLTQATKRVDEMITILLTCCSGLNLLSSAESRAEFGEKLFALNKYSYDNRKYFQVDWQGDKYGAGVRLLGIPETGDGYFTEIVFRWSPALVFSEDSLRNSFGEDYKNSTNPLVGRLWDYASDCGLRELFLGLPSLMNMSCNRCTTITIALDKEGEDCSEGGILFLYFTPWVLGIVRDMESFDISERKLWATWQYHFNDANPYFDTCSVCNRQLSLVDISDSDPWEVWRTISQLIIGSLSKHMLQIVIPGTRRLARPPNPPFGVSQQYSELSMISTSLFLATRVLEISDVSLSFLGTLPFMPIYIPEDYIFPAINERVLPQVDLHQMLLDLDSIYVQMLQYFLRVHHLVMSEGTWKIFDPRARYSKLKMSLSDLFELRALLAWFAEFSNKWVTSTLSESSGIVACKVILALSLLTREKDLAQILNPKALRAQLSRAVSISTSELVLNPQLHSPNPVFLWWFLIAEHVLDSPTSILIRL